MADISSLTLPNGDTVTFKDTTARQASKGRKVTVSMSTDWSGNGPYTQTVTVPGGTANSVVDLRPDSSTIAILLAAGVNALYVENNGGVFTAYAIGAAPNSALTVQAIVSEVST